MIQYAVIRRDKSCRIERGTNKLNDKLANNWSRPCAMVGGFDRVIQAKKDDGKEESYGIEY